VTQYKGTISNPDTLMVMLGNPNLRDCAFFDCFNALSERWWTYTINCEDTARDYPELLSPDRNTEIEEEFGRDSDVFRIRVLGEFPYQDPNSVMSAEDLFDCADPRRKARAMAATRMVGRTPRRAKQFGLDFARMGGDENVVYQRLGNAIIDKWIRSHVEPIEAVEAAFAMQVGVDWSNAETLFVADADGLGGGVMSAFDRANRRVFEFHAGIPAGNAQYANLATQAWFGLRRLVREKSIYIPRDTRLIEQLSSRKYTLNKKGQIIIWDTESYMKEGHDSPDRAVGCVQAFSDQGFAEGRHATAATGRNVGARVVGPAGPGALR
jgi:hypothetical protein